MLRRALFVVVWLWAGVAGAQASAEPEAEPAVDPAADADPGAADPAEDADPEADPAAEDAGAQTGAAGETDAAAETDAAETDAAAEIDAAGETDADTDADGPAEQAPEPPRGSDALTAAWIAFAFSVAAGVTGGLILAAGVDDLNTVENARGGTSWSTVEDAYARAPTLTAAGAAVLGVGAAGIIVAAILLAALGERGTWIEAAGSSVRVRF